MTEEINTILENMNLEDLQTLKKYCDEYFKEETLINKLQNNLDKFSKEKNTNLKPTKKETDIKNTLNMLRKLPKKRTYQLRGNLDENEKIENLEIENQPINKDVLASKTYTKMFFKKQNNGLYNALIFMIISIILFNIGLSHDIMVLKIIAVIGVLPVLVDCINRVYNNKLTPKLKTHISRNKIMNLIKKLEADYIIEKENSENMHLQNQLFLESKEDIFQRMLETHRNRLEEIAEEIKTIIGSSMDEKELIEQINIEPLIQTKKQKILKKSL